MVPFSFQNEEMFILECGGLARAGLLFWPKESALLVADLHLEKGSFYAQQGAMLPPYDSYETLERLSQAIQTTGARRLLALGDNFHDSAGPERITSNTNDLLATLMRQVDWMWITGNHDPHLSLMAGGQQASEIMLNGIMLRHEAKRGSTTAEISGHFHPRLTFHVRGRRMTRACFVSSETRLILPAFGTLTGGMAAQDPAIIAALMPAHTIEGIIPVKNQLLRRALWQKDP